MGAHGGEGKHGAALQGGGARGPREGEARRRARAGWQTLLLTRAEPGVAAMGQSFPPAMHAAQSLAGLLASPACQRGAPSSLPQTPPPTRWGSPPAPHAHWWTARQTCATHATHTGTRVRPARVKTQGGRGGGGGAASTAGPHALAQRHQRPGLLRKADPRRRLLVLAVGQDLGVGGLEEHAGCRSLVRPTAEGHRNRGE